MKKRAIWVLLLALICGTSAALGMNRLRPAGVTSPPETTPIVVARQDIPRGCMMTADLVELKDWPKSLLPKNALLSAEAVVGRSAAASIISGDVVSDGKFAPKEAGRGVAALIPAGMRAYTIQTSKAAANVAGFVLPGNRVDVLLALRSYQNDGTGGGTSTTLLQAVEILAVDQRLDAPAENKVDVKDLQSVTLLVTPQQAALLDLGQSLGQLSLSLRNMDDKAEAVTAPATLASLRFHQDGTSKTDATPAELKKTFFPSNDRSDGAEPRTSIRTLREALNAAKSW